MSKGKHKRKQQLAEQKAHQRAARAMLMEEKKMTNNEAEATAKTTNKTTHDEKPSRWQSFKEYVVRKSSFTDWCIATFTFVLASAAIYQFVIMGGQLDTMRKDQRPWIKVSFTSAPLQPLTPVGGTAHLVNNGKTPARGIQGDFVVEGIRNGDQPRFDYPQPHVIFKTGMIAPNDIPQDVQVERKQFAGNGSDIESYPVTVSELDDFKQVKIFFIVYGTVRYSDFFGINHWTKFCNYMVPPNVSGNVTAEPCADYGDVDTH